MYKKFIKWVKSIFKSKFVSPAINEELEAAINQKANARLALQKEETDKYTFILNEYLRTYFSKKYDNMADMKFAFDVSNRKWQRICRDVNQSNKLINLNKNAFSNQVKLVIKKIKEND